MLQRHSAQWRYKKCSTISMHSLTCRVRHRPSYKTSPQKHCRAFKESRRYKKKLHYNAMLAGHALEKVVICWHPWVFSLYVQPPWNSDPPRWRGRIVHYFITHTVDSAATRPNKEGDISLSVLAWCDAEVVKEVWIFYEVGNATIVNIRWKAWDAGTCLKGEHHWIFSTQQFL